MHSLIISRRVSPSLGSIVDSRCLCITSLFEKRLKISANLIKYQKSNAVNRLEILSCQSSIPVSLVFYSLSFLKGSLELAMLIRRDVLLLIKNYDGGSFKKPQRDVVGESADALLENNTSHKELIALLKIRQYWKEMDSELKRWLLASFSSELLYLQQVSFDTSSGTILNKIARGESVHPVNTLSDMKRSLSDGRR